MAFGGFSQDKSSQPIAEINMVPLIDVMLVLLVIFMLTAPLLTSAVRLDLPSADAPPAAAAPAPLTLALDAKGALFLNDRPMTSEQLRERLQDAARLNPEAELQLRADQSLAYGRVVEVMALAQKAGLSRIGFVAQPVR